MGARGARTATEGPRQHGPRAASHSEAVSEWAAVSDRPVGDRSIAGSHGAAQRTFDAPGLTAATGGRSERSGSLPIHAAAVDSRRLTDGNAFFALIGVRTDGHRFLDDAVAAGAAALVVTEALPDSRLDALHGNDAAVTIVRVSDAAVALRTAAAAYRDRFEPLVIGVTGSIAKTSVKEQIATVLDERFEVLKNEGNENNEIGLPLTLLRLEPQHQAAVLEMGLYTTGEIALLARLARPSIGVVTAVRGVHLSRAGSIEAIEAGKRELVEALPASGWAVLNVDDARVAAMAARSSAAVLGYGFSEAADVRATDIRPLGVAGMRFRLHLPHGSHELTTPMLGVHGVHNALAAAAVAVCAGLDAPEIVRGLGRKVSLAHRTQLLHAGEWNILDDSYNASPDAVLAALDLLTELPGRHLAVLGEMLELGPEAEAEHRRIGARAAEVVDRLVVVGSGAAGIAEGAIEAGQDIGSIDSVEDRDGALEVLISKLLPGDTVLVKASRGAELDLLVDRLVLLARAGEAST
ncbi:MAG: UDP-N-acetylmuramoyl-tripeptide--D-alanyl-D-alanine ligase [Chloroflexota bacterium]